MLSLENLPSPASELKNERQLQRCFAPFASIPELAKRGRDSDFSGTLAVQVVLSAGEILRVYTCVSSVSYSIPQTFNHEPNL